MELAAAEDVKIIGEWASPFALRPRIAFNLKGVHYQFLEENLRSKSDLLLNSNPVYKKIPVLLHGGSSICESMIIVQYIDDVWTSPMAPALLPADPYARAVHRFWASYVDDKITKYCMRGRLQYVLSMSLLKFSGRLQFLPALEGVLKAQNEEVKRENMERASAALKLLEEAFEKCSNGGKGFFNGDDVGYLDISLGSYLAWVRVLERTNGVVLLDEERTPLLAGWAERFCAHEAVKGVMPETEKLIHFAKTVAEPKWKAAAAAAAVN